MSAFEWIYPWLVISAPLFLGFVFREWFKVRLTESVRHEYSVEVEKMRSELRQNEKLFNEKIERESQRVTWLSSGALTNSASRQEQFFKRRLDSVDRLWASVIEARKYNAMTQILAMFNVDKMLDLVEKDPSQMQKFKASGLFNVSDDYTSILSAHASRPYVTILTWAYYSAFEAIVAHATATATAITRPMPKDMLDDKRLKSLLKAALPESATTIDELKSNRCYTFLQQLEDKIIWSIQNFDLKGQDLDDTLIAQARTIIEITDNGQSEASRKAAEVDSSVLGHQGTH